MSKIKGKTRDQVTAEGFNKFVKELKKEKWSMISTQDEYTNTKSNVSVSCPEGHEFVTTYNKFQSGRRCTPCTKGYQKGSMLSKITKEFEERGYTLLETEYVGNHIPLKCICKCGRETAIAYNNFTRNIGGCKECTNRTTFAEAVNIVEKAECVLLGPKQEFILNETHITYTCNCGNKYTGPWRTFLNGVRCPECAREKYKNTCNELYGVDNAFQYEEFKEKARATNRTNTGYAYPMQDPKRLSKMTKTSFSTKTYTFPSGKTTTIQGYEMFAIDHLLSQGIEEDDIITGETNVPQIEYYYNGRVCFYHPDIHVKSLNLLIEVKSEWTLKLAYDQNIKKFRAAGKKHYFLLWVYGPKGSLIQERPFHSTLNLVFVEN